jgi:hypothetical protein
MVYVLIFQFRLFPKIYGRGVNTSHKPLPLVGAHCKTYKHILYEYVSRNRDSSVGIATGWTAGVRFLARARDVSLLHSIRTCSEAHPVSNTMGIVGPSSRDKAAKT